MRDYDSSEDYSTDDVFDKLKEMNKTLIRNFIPAIAKRLDQMEETLLIMSRSQSSVDMTTQMHDEKKFDEKKFDEKEILSQDVLKRLKEIELNTSRQHSSIKNLTKSMDNMSQKNTKRQIAMKEMMNNFPNIIQKSMQETVTSMNKKQVRNFESEERVGDVSDRLDKYYHLFQSSEKNFNEFKEETQEMINIAIEKNKKANERAVEDISKMIDIASQDANKRHLEMKEIQNSAANMYQGLMQKSATSTKTEEKNVEQGKRAGDAKKGQEKYISLLESSKKKDNALKKDAQEMINIVTEENINENYIISYMRPPIKIKVNKYARMCSLASYLRILTQDKSSKGNTKAIEAIKTHLCNYNYNEEKTQVVLDLWLAKSGYNSIIVPVMEEVLIVRGSLTLKEAQLAFEAATAMHSSTKDETEKLIAQAKVNKFKKVFHNAWYDTLLHCFPVCEKRGLKERIPNIMNEIDDTEMI